MARPYHSPSSIALGVRCPRLWALEYIAKEREPEVLWTPELERAAWCQDCSKFHAKGAPCTTGVSAKQRGGAIGGALHTHFETWYEHRLPQGAWSTFIGQVALSGAHLLPHPDRVPRPVHTEMPIGNVPIACSACGMPAGAPCDCGRPRVALLMHGVLWAGYKDWYAYAPAEYARLGIRAPDGWAMGDHKSTANIEEYALTPAELWIDVQANLYGYDTCEVLGLKSIPGRWNYFETKKVRRAEPRDVTIYKADALDVMTPYAKLARELDTITRVEDAPQNPHACCDFGPPGKINCPHHVTNGGTCNARRSLGALIQARLKKDTTMPLSPEMQARFDALQAGTTAAAGNPAPPPETDAAPAPETKAADPAPATPAKPGRKFGNKAAGATAAKPGAGGTAAAAPAGGLAAQVGELATMLAAAEASKAEAEQQIATVKGMLQAALA